jgi:RNA polymerase sigma-70 factor, ECF subfamily
MTGDEGPGGPEDRDLRERAEWLAERFERNRARLVRVAYAVLGSVAEAEDVVADCWTRLVGADARDPVRDVEAWTTVAVGRAALDVLRSARSRRELYVGPWLPEPVVDPVPGLGVAPAREADPADRVTLDESVSYALLVVLESLSPAERTAWVLHDLFGLAFDEVAAVVGRSPAAVRQLASRARRHVTAGAPRLRVDRAEHDRTVAAFVAAMAGGGLAALVTALDPDVVLTSDGAGAVAAARRPVVGADKVARFLLGLVAKATPGQRAAPVLVNGDQGLLVLDGDRPSAVFALTTRAGRVVRVDVVRAPDKLARVLVSRGG